MTINLKIPDIADLKPRITVIGVGGAGGNGVNNMIESGLEGVEFIVANTDAQAVAQSIADRRIQIGATLTEGLGAGSQPQIGAAAAEEALPEIVDHFSGSHMVFITAGMGGGTGTGAAPVIARAARELGILTVAVVTKPFQFEGQRRMAVAEQGIETLADFVDTLIVIPNQNLFRIANEKTTFADAFAMADQVLYAGVAGITDLMVKDGLINLDFADVRAIINEMGKAMMGTGEASGEKRALEAAEAAISNPLLDDVNMRGARGLLISITGGKDLTLYEVDEAASRIREEADPEANIILGATFDDKLEGTMRVSVVATGITLPTAADQGIGEDLMDEAMNVTGAPASISAPIDAPEMPTIEANLGDSDPAISAPYGQLTGDELPAHALETDGQESTSNSPIVPGMPAIEDFPDVAQREIRAHIDAGGEIGGPAQKKTGFFERLASVGLGRKEPESQQAAAPQVEYEPLDAPGGRLDAPLAGSELPPAADDGKQTHPFIQAGKEVAGEVEEDELDIPAFLRRQAN